MSNEPSGPDRSYPDGSEMLESGEGTCALGHGSGDVPLTTGSTASQPPKRGFQFGIATLVLMMTLAALVLSVFRMAPGVAILLALVAAPALLRTCIVTMRRQRRGQSLSSRQKVALFLSSLVLIVAIIVALIAALMGACFAIVGPTTFGADVFPILVLASTMCLAAVCIVVMVVKHKWGMPQTPAPEPPEQCSTAGEEPR